jgi:hypothetical protein
VQCDATRLSIVLKRGDERSEVLVGDSAQLANLDAAKLAGAQQEVDLVASDVQHFGNLLNGVCLQMPHLLWARVGYRAAPLVGHVE